MQQEAAPIEDAVGESRGAAELYRQKRVAREAKALRKLRHPSRSEQLRSFLIED